MDTGLAGRTAIVTGAAGGIGLATIRALADEGCNVVGIDADADRLRIAAEADGARWHPFASDVTSDEAARRIVAEALSRFDRLDVLVTCAGVYETTAIDEMTHELWQRVEGVNVRGTFFCARAAIEAMAPRGWGRIVTVSSIAAHTGGAAAGAAYVASKGAVLSLTRSLAHTAGRHGITVNSVSPGVIETPMIDQMGPATRLALADRTPLGRTGTATEVAGAILLLASEAASFIHGADLPVTGGLAMP